MWPTRRIDLDRHEPPVDGPEGPDGLDGLAPDAPDDTSLGPDHHWLGSGADYRGWANQDPQTRTGAQVVDRPPSFTELILPESSLAESDLAASVRRAGPGANPSAGTDRSSSCS